MILPDYIPTNLQWQPKEGSKAVPFEFQAAGQALLMEKIKRNSYPHFCIHLRLGTICTVLWFGSN